MSGSPVRQCHAEVQRPGAEMAKDSEASHLQHSLQFSSNMRLSDSPELEKDVLICSQKVMQLRYNGVSCNLSKILGRTRMPATWPQHPRAREISLTPRSVISDIRPASPSDADVMTMIAGLQGLESHLHSVLRQSACA